MMTTKRRFIQILAISSIGLASLSLSGCFNCADSIFCGNGFLKQSSSKQTQAELVRAHRLKPEFSLRYYRGKKYHALSEQLREQALADKNTQPYAQKRGPRYFPRIRRVGKASYYPQYLDGYPTASGERLQNQQYTAAHNTLPFDSRIRVTNLETKESIIVRINDRMPQHPTHIIELSQAAAGKINLTKNNLTQVRLEVIK